MKIKPFARFSTYVILAISSSLVFQLSEKISVAEPVIPEAYKKALIDAAEPTPGEVLDKLTVINESNSRSWEGEPGKSRVLVVTFTSKNGYQLGRISPRSNGIWVTVFPELKDFCKEYFNNEVSINELNERVEKLLGLKPKTGYTHVVTIAVDPSYLKRPTPNPDIRTYNAQSLLNSPENIEPDYQNWLGKRIDEQVQNRRDRERPENYSLRLTNQSFLDDPYPWTGLGYTYDWEAKTNLQNHAGLSEFVIFPNPDVSTPIEIKEIVPTEKYCEANKQ